MPGIDFYGMPISSAGRTVLSVGKELGINFNIKLVNIMEKEQLKPEFLAINPQHTIPTIVDHDNGDFAVWESRVIATYLINKTNPKHKLYPTHDLKVKTVIDRWLYFDVSVLYNAIGPAILYPVLMQGQPKDPEKVTTLKENLAHLDHALSRSQYLASNEHYTLADLAVLGTMTNVELLDIDFSDLPNLDKWYKGLKAELPYYDEIHQKGGIDAMKAWVAARKAPA